MRGTPSRTVFRDDLKLCGGAFHSENGGAGEYRRRKGVVLDYRIVSEETFLMATFGRHKFPPWGMARGQDDSRNYIKIIRKDGREEVPGKVA